MSSVRGRRLAIVTTDQPQSGVDRARVKALKDAEDRRFEDAHPKSRALFERAQSSMPNGVPMAWLRSSYHHLPMWVTEGHGAHFTDVDGHEYRDFNIADMSMFCGYAPEPLVRAVSDRVARGNQFLLPGEDAIVVSEELARRFGLPKWQYTSSATHANTETIRVARVSPVARRCCCSTGSTSATSMRRSWSETTTGAWCRRSAACRPASRRAPCSRPSTTRRRWCRPSSGSTWRSS